MPLRNAAARQLTGLVVTHAELSAHRRRPLALLATGREGSAQVEQSAIWSKGGDTVFLRDESSNNVIAEPYAGYRPQAGAIQVCEDG